jgi:RNA polymerase sigma-70 factor (ECF subfamily)
LDSGSAESDRSLLALGRTGNQDALERLLSQHEPGLVRLCRGILGRAEDAEDAVQESFLRALRSIARFRGDSSVRTWLYRIAVNVCLEWKRSPGFRHVALPAEPTQFHPSPEQDVISRARVREALSTLQPRQRAAILLKELHGFSVAEVAVAMGWSVTRAQNELYKARKQLLAVRGNGDSDGLSDMREGVGR